MSSTRLSHSSKRKPTQENLAKAVAMENLNNETNNENNNENNNLYNMSSLGYPTNRNSISSISSRNSSNSKSSASSTTSSRSWLSRAAASLFSSNTKSEVNKNYELLRNKFNELNQYNKTNIFTRSINNNRVKNILLEKLKPKNQFQNSLRNLNNVDLTNILLRLLEKNTQKNMQIINKIFEVRRFNSHELNIIHDKCIKLNCSGKTTLLITAIENNNLEAVKLLVEKGASVQLRVDEIFNLMTPFIAALITGNEEIIKYLIDKINIENEKSIIKTLQLDYKNTLLNKANNYYKQYIKSIAKPVKQQLSQSQLANRANRAFQIYANSRRR
jgi:hypothetical protein